MTTARPTRLLTTSKAISEAIAQEMERDERVFVMGEDIGIYGGIFGATEGLLAKFGPERVMDTPISETGVHRRRHGRGAVGHAPDRRADVRRLLRRLHGPDLQPHGEDPLRVRREPERPGRADHRHRRRLRRRRPALADALRDVRPPARHEDRRALDALRRQGPDDLRDPGRQPGPLHVPQGRHGARLDDARTRGRPRPCPRSRTPSRSARRT